MTSTYAHPPTIDTSTCPHVAMMHAMMMHHDGVCCGCRWCGWQVSKGRNCDWNGEYAHTQLMICGKCRLQTAHALLHNQPATAAHQPAQLVSTQHSNCKMWTLHPCSLALLGLVLWHLQGTQAQLCVTQTGIARLLFVHLHGQLQAHYNCAKGLL